jgi:hypothetical protein
LFVAHLQRDVLCSVLSAEQACRLHEALLTGYRVDAALLARVDLYTAVGLMHLAPDPFRRRVPNWPQHIAAIIEHVQELTDAYARDASVAFGSEAHP